MASTIKVDTIQSTTSNVFFQNSVGTEYARFDSTGVFQLANPSSFAAGTAALPSITATGDTNTGIFFSAADTINFSTGGADKARISSGVHGVFTVGTQGSVAGLGTDYGTIGAWGSAGGGLRIYRGTASGTPIGTIYADAGGLFLSTSEAQPMMFSTNSTERARIDSSGNLLVGSTSVPSPVANYKSLVVGGTTGGIVDMGTTSTSYGRVSADSAGLGVSSLGAAPIIFRINATEVSRINSSGQLLVGTTTPESAVSNTKKIVGGSFSSFNGVLTSVSSGTAYTMFTMTADFTSYMVTVSALVSTAAYSETAIVHLNNTSVNVIIIAGGSAIAISNSGLAVQVTQSSGATVAELLWSAIRIT